MKEQQSVSLSLTLKSINCGCLGLHPCISSTKGTAAFHNINGDRCLQTRDLMFFFPQGLKHCELQWQILPWHLNCLLEQQEISLLYSYLGEIKSQLFHLWFLDNVSWLSTISIIHYPNYFVLILCFYHSQIRLKGKLNIKPWWGFEVRRANNNRSSCTVNTGVSPCLISDPCRAPPRRPLIIWSVFPSGLNPEAVPQGQHGLGPALKWQQPYWILKLGGTEWCSERKPSLSKPGPERW